MVNNKGVFVTAKPAHTFAEVLMAPSNPIGAPGAVRYQMKAPAIPTMATSAIPTAAKPNRQVIASLESLHGQHPPLVAK